VAGGSLFGGGRVTGGLGDVDTGESGWGYSQYGAPREDDGDDGNESPSGHHSGSGHSSSGSPSRGGIAVLGSTDDQDYVGGGIGWTKYGAPHADTGPGAQAPVHARRARGSHRGRGGRGHRGRQWALGALGLGLLAGALVWGVSAQQHTDTAVDPQVLSTTLPAPTVTSAPPSSTTPLPPSVSTSVSVLPTLIVTTTSAAPVTTDQAPPSVFEQTDTGPTTPVTLAPAPSTTSSVAPTTSTKPTTHVTTAQPTTSSTHHSGNNKHASAPNGINTKGALKPATHVADTHN